MQSGKRKTWGIGLHNALAGLAMLLRSQRNARIHAAATIAVVGLGILLRLSLGEWLWIGLAVGLVWMAEAMNTALELLADATVPEEHSLVGRAKDAAAGAVLVAAATAAFIGALLLGPPLLQLIAGKG